MNKELKICPLTINGKTLDTIRLKSFLKKGILRKTLLDKIWGLFREQGDFIPISEVDDYFRSWVSRGIKEGWLISNKNGSVFRTFVE